MITISRTYDLVWQYGESTKYKFTKEGRCFNTQTNRELKKTLVGGSVGFCLNGGFVSLTKIRPKLIKIKKYTYKGFGNHKNLKSC